MIKTVTKLLLWALLYGPFVAALLVAIALDNAQGATTIGREADVTVPSSASHFWATPNLPTDGYVSPHNPPYFSWNYGPTQHLAALNYYEYVRKYTFVHQLTTNNDFATPYWSVTNQFNVWNGFWPVTNAAGEAWPGSNWWRVIYLNSNATATWFTGAVHHYTLSNTPVSWDRSLLADTNALATKLGDHPRIYFNSGNLLSISNYLKTNTLFGWSFTTLTNTAQTHVLSGNWTTNGVTNWSAHLAMGKVVEVALAWQMTRDAFYLGTNDSYLPDIATTAILDYTNTAKYPNYTMLGLCDYDQGQIYPSVYLGMLYDYTAELMSAEQKLATLAVVRGRLMHMVYNNIWIFHGDENGTNAHTRVDSALQTANSHERHNMHGALALAIAGAENGDCLRLLPELISMAMGRMDGFSFDDGEGYDVNMLQAARHWNCMPMVLCNFQEIGATNAPWLRTHFYLGMWEKPSYYPSSADYGYDQNFLGDLSFGINNTMAFDSVGLTAWMLNEGALYQHYVRTFAIGQFGDADRSGITGGAYVPWYFPSEPTQTDTTNHYVNLDMGFAFGATIPPNNTNSFFDGCEFWLAARTFGNRFEHAGCYDGSPKLLAYGAHVSEAAITSISYESTPLFGIGLFVDGIGPLATMTGAEAVHGYIKAFTNGSDFTYACVDLTRLMNRSNAWTYSGEFLPEYNASTNRRPYVTLVERHLLFPHRKYWVFYDRFSTTQNAQFQWKWNIGQDTATVNTGACSFQYTADNTWGYGKVTVDVAHAVSPDRMTLQHFNDRYYYFTNPFTGTTLYDKTSCANYSNYLKITNIIWIANDTTTTNWHFLSVVYPRKWTNPTNTTITALDDWTVAVTNLGDGIGDVISWATNAPNWTNATYQVDAGGTNTLPESSPSPDPDPPSTNTVRGTIRAGRVTVGGIR